jgi:hypothetical protein
VRIRLSNNAKHSIKCFANPIGPAVPGPLSKYGETKTK